VVSDPGAHQPHQPEDSPEDSPGDADALLQARVPDATISHAPPGTNGSGPEWLRAAGPMHDVVLSSRVRLARNIAGCTFAAKATWRERTLTLEMCRHALMNAGLADRVRWVDIHRATAQDRVLLVERHLISKPHAKGRAIEDHAAAEEPRAVVYGVPDERLSVMVNEEDHLRIQAIRTGLDLSTAWQDADHADDKIEAAIDYAFSGRLGYLTGCPTNVGTGVRMSVMLHLPALRIAGEIEKVRRACADMNLAVRGFYGEGSEALGDLYQVSNQTTLGVREASVLEDLQSRIVPKIVEYERIARRELMTKRRLAIEDQVHRAYGLLTHARLLTTEETMQALSVLRLGILAGAVTDVNQAGATALMLLIQPAHLQRSVGRELDQDQRRAARAAMVRGALDELETG
jgi:protein arginine kinase